MDPTPQDLEENPEKNSMGDHVEPTQDKDETEGIESRNLDQMKS